jgi:predicted phosphodiesterase
MKDGSGAPEQASTQDKWLIEALEKAKLSKAENIMIFQHHPLFITDPNEPEQYFNIEPKKRKMYLDLYKKYNVKHIFVGHYHRNGFGQSGDIQMVTTGPVGKPLGRDSSGFRIVSVNGTDVKNTYYPLDSLPGKVSLNNKLAR